MRVLVLAGCAFVAVACARPGLVGAPIEADRDADRAAITAIVDAHAAEANRAWIARDAKLMFGDMADTVVVRTPEGRVITRDQMIADLQRRMNMTTRIDTMRTVVDSVLLLSRDEAVAYSSQRFVREMTLSTQKPRVRVSSVIHRQRFSRRDRKWRASGPIEELNPTARWADEPHSIVPESQ